MQPEVRLRLDGRCLIALATIQGKLKSEGQRGTAAEAVRYALLKAAPPPPFVTQSD